MNQGIPGNPPLHWILVIRSMCAILYRRPYILRFPIRQPDRVVSAGERVVARSLIRAEVHQQLARLLVLLGHSFPHGDDVAVESDTGRLYNVLARF